MSKISKMPKRSGSVLSLKRPAGTLAFVGAVLGLLSVSASIGSAQTVPPGQGPANVSASAAGAGAKPVSVRAEDIEILRKLLGVTAPASPGSPGSPSVSEAAPAAQPSPDPRGGIAESAALPYPVSYGDSMAADARLVSADRGQW